MSNEPRDPIRRPVTFQRRAGHPRDLRQADDPSFPEGIWEEFGRADELYEAMRLDGEQVRYEICDADGGVRATICDLDGNFLRPVGLRHALGSSGDEPPPAA